MVADVSKYTIESAYNDVERDALTRTQPQEQPKAVLLGGQPGSGKSALAAGAARELRNSGGAVVIDADRMREENPRYKQLSKDDPQNAADRTHKEAGEWATRLTISSMDNRRNLVVDGTMRSLENMRELTDRLKESGYTIEARVMAVSPETSMTRARLRFEEQVSERGTGRFVNAEQHDNAYKGIVVSVAALEREKLVDSVRIYDANQRQVYENERVGGSWRKSTEASKVLEHERAREWTHAERRDYVSVLEDIHSLAREREEKVGIAIGDRAQIDAKLKDARNDLATFEQSSVYQRAAAFDKMPKKDALERNPELDAAYRQLDAIKQSWTPQTSQDQREKSYFTARAEISEQLHRGLVPKANVSIDESRGTIDAAAAYRGLMVRDGQELMRNVKGEVIATSSQHALVKMSDMIAIRYQKSDLNREVQVGERVAVQYAPGKSQVYEQGKEPARDQSRGIDRDIER